MERRTIERAGRLGAVSTLMVCVLNILSFSMSMLRAHRFETREADQARRLCLRDHRDEFLNPGWASHRGGVALSASSIVQSELY